jgi:hypothetical protein
MRPGFRSSAPLTLLPLATLAVVLSPVLPRALANPPQPPASASTVSCSAPQPGRYVVMGDGEVQGEPVARILLETWRANGQIEGLRLERRGKVYREQAYVGRFRPLSLCRVGIERTYGTALSTSQAVLDPQGVPRYSLGTLPDVVVVSRWFRQPTSACSASQLDGTVVSQQQGRNWVNNRWQPNGVIQHETWRGGQVQGVAISSFGPRIEEATYSGSLSLGANCLATIQERDSLGVTYNYRAVLLADGSGYVYLQTDPNSIALGYLEHQAAAAGQHSQHHGAGTMLPARP